MTLAVALWLARGFYAVTGRVTRPHVWLELQQLEQDGRVRRMADRDGRESWRPTELL